LHPQGDHFFLRQDSSSKPFSKRVPRDIFHHEEVDTILCIELVDRFNVWDDLVL
jgi:hypothetical protein